jgi:hypothetical protein
MADDQIAELFSAGTASERDAVFAGSVDARIARARRASRLLALALRVAVIVMLAVAVFVTIHVLEPTFQQIAEISPEFMGVPVPLVLVAITTGVAIYAWRLAGLRLGFRIPRLQ